jgi:hypothetical protein
MWGAKVFYVRPPAGWSFNPLSYLYNLVGQPLPYSLHFKCLLMDALVLFAVYFVVFVDYFARLIGLWLIFNPL